MTVAWQHSEVMPTYDMANMAATNSGITSFRVPVKNLETIEQNPRSSQWSTEWLLLLCKAWDLT